MLLMVIAFLMAGVGIGLIVILLLKHWKDLRLLDPSSIKEEREHKHMSAIIERRFMRLHSDKIEPISRLGIAIKRSIIGAYHRSTEKLQALESVYRNMKHPLRQHQSTQDRKQSLLRESRAFIRDLKWADAERRLLEVLSLDEREKEAYKGLGTIYLKQNLLLQAKETFEFLVKIKEADDATYAGLADIAEAEKQWSEAEEYRIKSVEYNPHQSYRQYQLAYFYVTRNESEKAWPSAKRASDLEPMSAKYLELSLEVAILLRDRKETRNRYDRLRLLSEDRTRYQSWREKVEELEKGK